MAKVDAVADAGVIEGKGNSGARRRDRRGGPGEIEGEGDAVAGVDEAEGEVGIPNDRRAPNDRTGVVKVNVTAAVQVVSLVAGFDNTSLLVRAGVE